MYNKNKVKQKFQENTFFHKHMEIYAQNTGFSDFKS